MLAPRDVLKIAIGPMGTRANGLWAIPSADSCAKPFATLKGFQMIATASVLLLCPACSSIQAEACQRCLHASAASPTAGPAACDQLPWPHCSYAGIIISDAHRQRQRHQKEQLQTAQDHHHRCRRLNQGWKLGEWAAVGHAGLPVHCAGASSQVHSSSDLSTGVSASVALSKNI